MSEDLRDALPVLPGASGATAVDPEALAQICAALRRRHGVDFLDYKRPTLLRRIERRLVDRGVDLAGYAALLGEDEGEVDRLHADLLIGVSSFFRDPATWGVVAEQALTTLWVDRPADRPVRAWVAGCASGEEAFTVAMLLHEAAQAAGQGVEGIKVFATDANPQALAVAGRGIYTAEQIASVPPALRARYFEPDEGGSKVSAALRQAVVFARHDLLDDPPFGQIDLITCRNLLIYLKTSAQQRVMERLRFALAERGWLLLGPSEHPGAHERYFEAVVRSERLYRLRPAGFVAARAAGLDPEPRPVPDPATGAAVGPDVYAQVIDRFVPACLLVDPAGQIAHVFGDAGRFVELGRAPGRLDVLQAARPALRAALGGALRRLAESGEPAHQPAVATGDPAIPLVDLRVERLQPLGAKRSFVVVGFIATPPGGPPITTPPDEAVRRLADLEAELDYTRQHLSATTEELTATNEELHAANEELHATNEELHITNEELHSANEEQSTLNAELRRMNAELWQLSADVDHLLKSSAIGAIFLDAQLGIRKSTPAAARLFDLQPGATGRTLADLRSDRVDVAALVAHAERVRDTGAAWEETARLADGAAVLVRLLPEVDEAGSTRGVVITLTDVSALDRARSAQAESERRLAVFARHLPQVMWLSSADTGEWLFVSDAFREVWGIDPQATVDLKTALLSAIHPDDRPVLEAKRRQMNEGGFTRFDYRIVRPDGSVRWLETRNYPIEGEQGEALIAGLTEDVTEERARQALVDQLRRDKERASAIRDAVLQATTEHIFMLDDRGHIVFANQPALTAWRRTAAEISGATLAELRITTDEEDPLERLFDRVLRTGRAQQGEDRLTLPAGPATFEFTLTPVRDARWRVSHVVVVARDITRRALDREAARQNLRRLHTVADAVRDPIALVDGVHHIVFANPAFAAFLGEHYSLGERDVRALLGRRGLQAVVELIEDAWRVGAEVRQDVPFAFGGEAGMLAVRILPAGDEVFLKLRDVTHSRRTVVAATRLQSTPPDRRQRERLEAVGESARTLDRVLAGLVADLERATAAALTAASDAASGAASDAPSDPESAAPGAALTAALTAALATAREAAALCHPLTTVDESESAPGVDIAALAHEMQPLLALSIPDRVRLVVQAPATSPPARIDPNHARQLILSLVVHAAESIAPAASGTVRLRIRPDERCVIAGDRNRLDTALPDGPCLTIDVGDDGPGLSAVRLRHLFTVADPAANEIGLGLGLDAAQIIARNHGAAMSADSVLGGGTTLRIALPMVAGAAVPPPLPSRPRVLIAAADPARRSRVRHAVALDAEIDEVETGLDALRRFRVAPTEVSLLVIDARPTGIALASTLSAVKALTPDLPIMVLADEDDATDAINAIAKTEAPDAIDAIDATDASDATASDAQDAKEGTDAPRFRVLPASAPLDELRAAIEALSAGVS